MKRIEITVSIKRKLKYTKPTQLRKLQRKQINENTVNFQTNMSKLSVHHHL